MPTASEFRNAAAELEDVLTEMSSFSGLLGDLRQNSGLVGASLVRSLVEGAIDAANDHVPGCFGMLSAAMGDLEWRAQVCDEYANELRRWRAAQQLFADNDDGTGRPPVMPQKPYHWVDV